MLQRTTKLQQTIRWALACLTLLWSALTLGLGVIHLAPVRTESAVLQNQNWTPPAAHDAGAREDLAQLPRVNVRINFASVHRVHLRACYMDLRRTPGTHSGPAEGVLTDDAIDDGGDEERMHDDLDADTAMLGAHAKRTLTHGRAGGTFGRSLLIPTRDFNGLDALRRPPRSMRFG